MTVSSSSPVVGWAEQAKARCEAATEGPWLAANEKTGRRGVALVGVEALRGRGEAGCIAVFAGGGDLWKTRNADADFTANARADLPRALEALEVAVKENAALNAEVERLRAVAMRILAWTPVTEYDGGKAWGEGWNGSQEFVQSILRAALEVSE